jgi:hypothetical protein
MRKALRLKPGTRIEVRGWGTSFDDFSVPAKIDRVRKLSLPIPAGFQPIVFADGRKTDCYKGRYCRPSP